MLAEAFRKPGERMPIGGLGAIGLVGAAIASWLLWNRNAVGFGVIVSDNFALFVNFVLVGVGLLTIMFSQRGRRARGLPQGEYYALTLFAIAGMMLMARPPTCWSSSCRSRSVACRLRAHGHPPRSSVAGTEGAFKYFLLGAFSSAFFLYGIAFTYALVGSTRLEAIASAIAGADDDAASPMTWLALGLLLVGFAFKVSAVPFHMWTPDAYEGAPTVVTGFMSTGVKAAAFAAFVRVFLVDLRAAAGPTGRPSCGIAPATMILGTVVGVVQTNAKRMLAYSSIAHAGYLLSASSPPTRWARRPSCSTCSTYALTNVGAFGVVALIATPERPGGDVRDFAACGTRGPRSPR
jgi:NADH-quinone oxidoreductase subunit N